MVMMRLVGGGGHQRSSTTLQQQLLSFVRTRTATTQRSSYCRQQQQQQPPTEPVAIVRRRKSTTAAAAASMSSSSKFIDTRLLPKHSQVISSMRNNGFLISLNKKTVLKGIQTINDQVGSSSSHQRRMIQTQQRYCYRMIQESPAYASLLSRRGEVVKVQRLSSLNQSVVSMSTTSSNVTNNYKGVKSDDDDGHHDERQIQDRKSAAKAKFNKHVQNFRENPRESAVQGAKSAGGMMKKYGPVFIGSYLGIYFSTLAALWMGVESGLMDPVTLFSYVGGGGGEAGGAAAVDPAAVTTAGAESSNSNKNTVDLVVHFLQNHAWTEPYADIVERYPSLANLGVAWIAVKFTEPLRLAVAIAVTPKVSRYLGYSSSTTKKEEDAEASKTKM